MDITDIIEKVAKERKISPKVVMMVWRTQFKFALEAMQSGKGESIRLRHFGLFTPKTSRVKAFESYNKKLNNGGQADKSV